MSRRVLKVVFTVVLLLVGFVVILIFAVRDASALKGRVARHVTIAGFDVSGKTAQELDTTIDDIEQQLRITPVRVATFDGGFQATGASFGLTVDHNELHIRALKAQRPAKISSRIARYFTSFFQTEEVVVPASADRTISAKTLSEREGSKRRDPVDPQLRVRNGAFAVLPGSDGEGIDVDAIVGQFPGAVAKAGSEGSITLTANRVPLPSRFTNDDLQRLVDLATTRTANPIAIVSDGLPYEISSERLRAWVTPQINDRQLRLMLDAKKTVAGLEKILGKVPRPAVDAAVTINELGEVVSTPSASGVACCADDSVQRLERALSIGPIDPVTIELKTLEPQITTEQLASYKIVSQLSTFTTKHRSGEARVKNIHRIADLVRGVIIPPGTTFSVNKFVGERTTANGFVDAHVIEDGVFKDSIGGGISQFATTLFNAAFFGGLEIPEHKAHSIYISRYPFGREATLSWEKPDLKIRNNTPYGILIWPTYTASSLTVTMYSSPFAVGEAGKQTVTTRGDCKVVVTNRIRTFTDGTTTTDSFKAEYLPKEGVGCDGLPTPGATTTTVKPRPTNPQSETTAASNSSGSNSSGGDTSGGDTSGGAQTVPVRTTIKASGGGETAGSTTAPRVQAGGGSTKATKPPASGGDSGTPTGTKPPKTDPKPVEPKVTEPKPVDPSATEPPAGGGVVVPVAPPITGVG